jgi:hypothetical protein
MTRNATGHTAADRARRRAIREFARQADLPYAEAARQLAAAGLAPGETLASHGRTVYPTGADTHRRALIDAYARRPAAERVRDARRAADLPAGRAAHLADRFPPTRGDDGTGVGPLYHGAGRQGTLTLLYTVVGHEAPGLLPSPGDLLDAVLMVSDDGHAPGTRVRMLTRSGDLATVVGVVWGSGGPPLRYRVRPDGGSPVLADPADLVVLASQSRC